VGRIRSIKPQFFSHEGLFDLEQETGLPVRIAFAALWCEADREGRFEWRPRRLKLSCLPYDDVDFSRVLDALVTRGFIVRYASGGRDYAWIPSWKRHQVINNREKASDLPEPPESGGATQEIQGVTDASSTRETRVTETHVRALVEREGEGEREREREGDPNHAGSTTSNVGGAPDADPRDGKPGVVIPVGGYQNWRAAYPETAHDEPNEQRLLADWRKAITADTVAVVQAGTERYEAHCREQAVPPQYVRSPRKFLAERDYLRETWPATGLTGRERASRDAKQAMYDWATRDEA